MKARDVILVLSVLYDGNWSKILEHLSERKDLPELKGDVEEMHELAQIFNIGIVTVLDDEYPNTFRQILKPPFVIYSCKGKCSNKIPHSSEFKKLLFGTTK